MTHTRELRAETGNHQIEIWTFDLSSQESIHRLAQHAHAALPRIDVLVNNVGAVFLSRKLSPDGIEMTWALNHLGVFQLTLLLLDLLQTGDPARIINVSSSAHHSGEINWDDLEMTASYQYMKAYGQSKLANVLFTYELAKRLRPSPVITHALHPGFVRTRIGADNGILAKLLQPLLFRLMAAKTIEDGAKTSLYLATSTAAAQVSGKILHL